MGFRKFATIVAMLSSLYNCSSSPSSVSNIDAIDNDYSTIEFVTTDVLDEKVKDLFSEEQTPYETIDVAEKHSDAIDKDNYFENTELPPDVIQEVSPDVIPEVSPDLPLEVNPDLIPEVSPEINPESDSIDEEGIQEVLNEVDCPNPQNFYLDNDNDGYGDSEKSLSACVPPEGYVDNNLDCNDNDENINPDAVEKCNFKDDNCDLLIDEGFSTSSYYLDGDKDGYGGGSALDLCKNPDSSKYITLGGDCKDNNINIYPDALEACNGKDDNCNDITDDGGNALCDNSAYCDGQETCTNGACKPGMVVDCSENDLGAINICNYNPDSNPLTRDTFFGFTSVCDEGNDKCTTSTINVTSTCDVARCGAECDATNTCAPTKCDTLDGCVGNNYYDYADRINSCNDDCTCTDNVCASPTITPNDSRCTPCQTDENCSSLNNVHCEGDLVQQDTGKCIDYNCVVQTTTTQDCNVFDKDKCVGTQIQHDNYTCAVDACTLAGTALVQDCDNGIPCDGQETCLNATCLPGIVIDCSVNDLGAINTCDYTPDGNSKTKDTFPGFTSTCDDLVGLCTTEIVNLTHTCDVAGCGAECDVTNTCAPTDCNTLDGCVGKDYQDYANVDNTCKDDCTCTDNVCGSPTITPNDPRCTPCQTDENCSSLNNVHCEGDLVQQDAGKCVDYNCVVQTTTLQDCNDLDANKCVGTQIVNDNYACAVDACTLAGTALVQDCNEGLFCNGSETCSNATCVPGVNVDCSNYNLAAVNSCNNVPDGNSLTRDVYAGFTSSCDEGNDKCTTSTVNITSTCDVNGCGAVCDLTHACAPTECDTLDGCVGNNYYDYMDRINECNTDCTCTTNVCANPTITPNDPRCTECQTDNECNQLDKNYCDGDLVKQDNGVCSNYTCTTQT
ncbi:MAG: putative metal-binding motif-containing protein, partial [Candidatus Woesearchaeota archaeon]